MARIEIPRLPKSTVLQRARALRQVITQQAQEAVGPASRFSDGCAADSSSSEAAEFLALLECSYLVAAADNISTEELSGLSKMIELVTGEQLTPSRIQTYFNEFARGVAQEGLSARIVDIAQTLQDFLTRQEALHFAALFALADGQLVRGEARVLLDLAAAFGASEGELQLTLNEVAGLLTQALEAQ